MAKVNKIAPWNEYYNELRELFKKDITVKVMYDEKKKDIKVYVADPEKAAALDKLLPSEKTYGDEKLTISVIPANGTEDKFNELKDKENVPISEIMENAFTDNDAVVYFWNIDDLIPGLNLFYVAFNNKVVQYYSDNIGDPHGLTSTLYENIARDVFLDIPGVFYCTAVPDED